jgi:hypothetical protein
MTLITNKMAIHTMDIRIKSMATDRTKQPFIRIKINQIATTDQTAGSMFHIFSPIETIRLNLFAPDRVVENNCNPLSV